MWLKEGRARQDLPTTIANFREAWNSEISVHFLDEERLLLPLPLSQSSLDRLVAEHNELRQLIDQLDSSASADLCFLIGQSLEAHIRWEEHEFFPEIERSLSSSQLEELKVKTGQIESGRSRHL